MPLALGANGTPPQNAWLPIPQPRSREEFARALGLLDLTQLPYLPDFLVISPAKTGSTWLSANLQRHPQVFIPAQKEIKYFCHRWREHDINWYLAHFREGACKRKGEASPTYAILSEPAIETLSLLLPRVRLVFLMRDPVSRIWSHVKHCFRYREAGFQSRSDPLDGISDAEWLQQAAHPWIAGFSDYAGCLRRWLRHFPKEQLFVEFSDSIVRSPRELLARVFEHLRVRTDVDWSRFPVSEKILEGIPKQIPGGVEAALQVAVAPMLDELSSLLRVEFSLDIPAQWIQRTGPHRAPAGAERRGTPSLPTSPQVHRPRNRSDPADRRYFLITSYGRTATYWLASSLNCHPAVVCSHGKVLPPVQEYSIQPPDEHALHGHMTAGAFLRKTLDEVFEELERAREARVYGFVHAYSAQELCGQPQLAHARRRYVALNLVRHPVTRTESLARRLLHEVRFSPVARQRLDREFDAYVPPDLLAGSGGNPAVRLTTDADRAFAYATCFVLAHDQWDFSTPIPHIPMERLTKDPECFAWLFSEICQGAAQADASYLSRVFGAGRRNVQAEEMTAVGRYAEWEPWKQVFFSYALLKSGLEQRYRGLGYDLSFLVETGRPSPGESAHDLPLANPGESPHTYDGFAIHRVGDSVCALAEVLGPLDPSTLGADTLERYQRAGLCVISESVEQLTHLIDTGAYLLHPAGPHPGPAEIRRREADANAGCAAARSGIGEARDRERCRP